jgi:hypothetical protein
MNRTKKISACILVAAIVIGISISAQAEALQQMQSALVYLKKARMTNAVQAKNENLKKAKEQLIMASYDKGGYCAAAITLTMQATAKVGEFKIDKANQLIDMAIVKVKHGIQAFKQEASAKKKSASVKK